MDYLKTADIDDLTFYRTILIYLSVPLSVRYVPACDQPSCVTVGQLVGELWHFEYFQTWRPSAILNLKKFNT